MSTAASGLWIVFALQFAAGALIIVMGVPLARRRVPPNQFYGIRFPSMAGDDRVWYEINAKGGRHFIYIGLLYLAVVGLAVAFGDTWPILLRFLGPMAILVVALLADTVMLASTASRMRA